LDIREERSSVTVRTSQAATTPARRAATVLVARVPATAVIWTTTRAIGAIITAIAVAVACPTTARGFPTTNAMACRNALDA
jgi:hypothetical protein